MSRTNSGIVPRETESWIPKEIARRINQARGAYLQRTGQELKWSEIGRTLATLLK